MFSPFWYQERNGTPKDETYDDVVIMQDGTVVRGKWRVGRVIEVFPGKDDKVRNVKIRTAAGEYARPVQKLQSFIQQKVMKNEDKVFPLSGAEDVLRRTEN